MIARTKGNCTSIIFHFVDNIEIDLCKFINISFVITHKLIIDFQINNSGKLTLSNVN
jgi:hypothetical protein